DFGYSSFLNTSVSRLIAERLPYTLWLGFFAILLASLVALPLGVAAAVYRDSPLDRFVVIISVVAQAVPTFWISLLFIVWFGIKLRWLPISGSGTWAHF